MLKKGSKLYSIVNFKCPKCHEGDFFVEKSALKLKAITKTHDNCPSCNLKYMMEPSFFFGSMFVAYGLTVALAVAIFVISNLIFGLNLLQTFASIIIVLLLTAPINLRISRIIWINIFVSYSKKK